MFDPNRQVLINKPKKLTKKQKKQLDGLFKQGLSYLDNPKIKPKIEKQISLYDRYNALLRMLDVKAIVDLVEKETNTEKRCLLERGLESDFKVDYHILKSLFKNPSNIEKTKGLNYDSIHVFCNWEKNQPIQDYRSGKHIIIAVDLSKKRKDIEEDFKRMLTRLYKDNEILKTKDKDKGNIFDIWQVYGLKKQGLNNSELARNLSGVDYTKTGKRSAAYNKDVDKYRQVVKRAYERANEIIKAIEKEIKEIKENRMDA